MAPASTRRLHLLAGLAALVLLAWAALTSEPADEASTTPSSVASVAGGATATTVGSGTTLDEDPHQPPTRPATAEELGGLAFTDVSSEVGIGGDHATRTLEGAEDMSGGVSVGDVDGDGDLDVYVTRVGGANSLYRNDGGRFTDVATEAGVAGEPGGSYAGATFGDVDGDGWLDLVVTSAGASDPLLFLNQGDRRFREASVEWGVTRRAPAGEEQREFSATFADWDRDEDLDLVVVEWFTPLLEQTVERADPPFDTHDQCRRGAGIDAERAEGQTDLDRRSSTRFLRNEGDRFVDAGDLGVDVDGLVAFTSMFSDLDGDGWPDLFLIGDFCTSAVYRNEQGTGFVEITDELGVGTDENGMASVFEDLDGDGRLDWFITGISYPGVPSGECPTRPLTIGCTGNRLYRGTPAGGFEDVTDRFGVRDAFWGWGAEAQDLNDDGRRDLVVAAGFRSSRGAVSDDPVATRSDGSGGRIWLGVSSPPFPEVAAQVGLTATGNGKALVAFDYDGDGDLDLIQGTTEGSPILYRNDLPRDDDHASATLELRQPGGRNRFAVGARVRALVSDGSEIVAEVRGAGTFQSGGPLSVHLGLGKARLDAVEVTWPDGSTERFEDVPGSGSVTLVRGTAR